MRVAVYPSVLYGEDFIVESIQSILPHVDRVFVVMMDRPWGNALGVTYKGEWVPWPDRFDETRERIQAMHDPRIEVVEADKFSPANRWGFAVVDVVMPRCPGIDEVVLLDPDCVFSVEEAAKVFSDWEAHQEYQWASVPQIELWRTPDWQVVRPRSMVSLHRGDLLLLSDAVRGARGAQAPETHTLDGVVHNFGFCVSTETMRWKHLCAMAFSPDVGESLPNPDWYEDKWLAWTPEVRDLDVSIGCESGIPCAVPFAGPPIPASIERHALFV